MGLDLNRGMHVVAFVASYGVFGLEATEAAAGDTAAIALKLQPCGR